MPLYLIRIKSPNKDLYGLSAGQEFELKDDEKAKEKAKLMLSEVRKSGINSPGAKIFKLIDEI